MEMLGGVMSSQRQVAMSPEKKNILPHVLIVGWQPMLIILYP
jgi:hypothetical protein